jgi:UDP-N-acetylglucosamine--N-acetylmuramyl-(pentapeptide) pyrophosphoryl-undecaprenol N-acetylglucosamine transferase
MIAGGGTGGHIFPGLALADAFVAGEKDVEVVFVGAERGLEKRLVPEAGYRLITLPVAGVMGMGLVTGFTRALGLLGAVFKALGILGREKPDLVVGVGGYASVPAVLAAALRGVPRSILEQNVMPGRANRILARFVQRIYQGFASRHEHFAADKTVVAGNPIRSSAKLPTGEVKQAGGTTLLVMGGSQGARQINQLCMDVLPALMKKNPDLKVLHQTGSAHVESVRQGYEDAGVRAEVVSFIERMGQVYARTDLCLSRAGAMAVSELAAAGIPALLIPFPESAGGHQKDNAMWLKERGGAVVFNAVDVSAEELESELAALLKDRALLKDMSAAAKSAGVTDAAEKIAQMELERIGLLDSGVGD